MKLFLIILFLSFSVFAVHFEQNKTNPSCYSDYSCGIGEACVKENSWSSQGYCLKVINKYGSPDYSYRKDYKPKVMNECFTVADCPPLFRCEAIGNTYRKTCVR